MCYSNFTFRPTGEYFFEQEILRDNEVNRLLQQIETANDFNNSPHDLSLKYREELDNRISKIKAKYNI